MCVGVETKEGMGVNIQESFDLENLRTDESMRVLGEDGGAERENISRDVVHDSKWRPVH